MSQAARIVRDTYCILSQTALSYPLSSRTIIIIAFKLAPTRFITAVDMQMTIVIKKGNKKIAVREKGVLMLRVKVL
jgi:hypothetical protein